jgi:chromatin remodeling complex protein RSC6
MKRASKTQTKSTASVASSDVTLSVKSEPLVKSLDVPSVVPSVVVSPSTEEVVQKPKKAPAKRAPKEAPAQVPSVTPTTTSQSSTSSKSELLEVPTTTMETLDGELLNVDEFDARCAEFYTKLQELTSGISTIRSEFKAIEKVWAKRIKSATKTSGKKKKKSGNRAPSGFVKPTKISDELALFLSKPTGTEMARTEVTREINQYIRANQLQDTTNGRKINADQKLSTLLHLPPDDELTYFNLQKYMSIHFPKAVVPALVV